MKNAYAKEQAELRRKLLNYGALVGQQFNVDMMCLALNEEGFGHDRIMRIIHRAEKHGEYFSRVPRLRRGERRAVRAARPAAPVHLPRPPGGLRAA